MGELREALLDSLSLTEQRKLLVDSDGGLRAVGRLVSHLCDAAGALAYPLQAERAVSVADTERAKVSEIDAANRISLELDSNATVTGASLLAIAIEQALRTVLGAMSDTITLRVVANGPRSTRVVIESDTEAVWCLDPEGDHNPPLMARTRLALVRATAQALGGMASFETGRRGVICCVTLPTATSRPWNAAHPEMATSSLGSQVFQGA
jgi:hypothetical protein